MTPNFTPGLFAWEKLEAVAKSGLTVIPPAAWRHIDAFFAELELPDGQLPPPPDAPVADKLAFMIVCAAIANDIAV